MNVSTHHLRACMEVWLHCESLLNTLVQSEASFSKRTTRVLDECANICLGTLQSLKNGPQNVHELALLCVGICEECAEVCERYNEKAFQSCAVICRKCSTVFAPIAFPAA